MNSALNVLLVVSGLSVFGVLAYGLYAWAAFSLFGDREPENPYVRPPAPRS